MPEYYLAYIYVDGAFSDFKRSKAVFSPLIMPACEYCNHSPRLDGEVVRHHKLRTYVPRDRIDALFDGSEGYLYPNSHDKHMHVYVDAARWNGNNIFKLIGIGCEVADQTFVDWADGNNLKCCHFVPESEPCRDWGRYEDAEMRFGPGLRYDLD